MTPSNTYTDTDTDTHTHTQTHTHTHTIGNPRKYLFYNHINFQATLYKHYISCPSSFDSN